jgi:hypothetical protein
MALRAYSGHTFCLYPISRLATAASRTEGPVRFIQDVENQRPFKGSRFKAGFGQDN